MIAKLVFKMPEDQHEYQSHMNGPKYEYGIHEFYNEYLRKIYKYNDTTELVKEYKADKQQYRDPNTPVINVPDEEIADVIEWFAGQVRSKLHEYLQDAGVVED